MEKRIARDLYMVCSDIESKWRISTTILEMAILKYIPECLKQKMRLIKFLFQQQLIYKGPYETRQMLEKDALKIYGHKPFIPSFALKLIFLHGVMTLYVDGNGLSQNCCQNNDSLEDKITNYMLHHLRNLKYHNAPSSVKIMSFLFGSNHNHKFMFGHDLASLVEDRSSWYEDRLDRVEQVMTGKADHLSYTRSLKLMNYPANGNILPYGCQRLHSDGSLVNF
jgi:hypothetical protein